MTRRTLLQSAAFSPLAARPATSPNGRIQIGVIGTGARSQELMSALLAIPEAEIIGVVDAYKGRVERAISRTGGRAKPYPDYPALLARKDIDAVVIATPDHWHRTMVLDAIVAGKDVYCEKPLTYRASEGPEIIRAALDSKRILQVGSQGISSALQRKAKEIVQSGKLGQITLIRAAYNRNTASGAWLYPIPPDASPATVDWNMFLGPAPRRPFNLERFFRWRCYWDYSGGIATDLFVHLCTTIHFLTNAEIPARAAALGELYRWKNSRDVPDTLNGVLEYPEGFAVNLSSTFNNQSSSEASFQILGTEGTLTIGGDSLKFQPESAREDNRWIVESWPERLEQEYYRDPKVRQAELPDTHPQRVLAGAEQYLQEGYDTTIEHMRHWLESIRTRRPYWEDPARGHHAAACAHMVNRAAREKRIVEWDFSKDDIRA